MARMTSQEKRWQAESDVRTVRDYATLRADEARFTAASETLAKEQAQIQAALDMNAILRRSTTKTI